MHDELSGPGVPGPGDVRRFTRDGATMVVEEHGEGDRTFVLVHGIGMGRSVLAGLARALLPYGRIVAMDLPGFGEAPEPARTPTMERLADLVAALLAERAYPGVVLVGHSMGSQVATEVAVRHPDVVERLVLAAPTSDSTARTALHQLSHLTWDLAAESPVVLAKGLREYLRAGPHLRRKIRATLVHRPEDAYPRVGVPTLVLRGARDRVVPDTWCDDVVAAIPQARLVVITGHGHETVIRDPRRAAAEIAAFARDVGRATPSGEADPRARDAR